MYTSIRSLNRFVYNKVTFFDAYAVKVTGNVENVIRGNYDYSIGRAPKSMHISNLKGSQYYRSNDGFTAILCVIL